MILNETGLERHFSMEPQWNPENPFEFIEYEVQIEHIRKDTECANPRCKHIMTTHCAPPLLDDAAVPVFQNSMGTSMSAAFDLKDEKGIEKALEFLLKESENPVEKAFEAAFQAQKDGILEDAEKGYHGVMAMEAIHGSGNALENKQYYNDALLRLGLMLLGQKRWKDAEPLLTKAMVNENQSDRTTRAMLAFNSAMSIHNRNRFKKGMSKAKVLGRMARMGGFSMKSGGGGLQQGDREGEEEPEEEEAAPAPTPWFRSAVKLEPIDEKKGLPLARGEGERCYCPGTLKVQKTAGSICQECGCIIKLPDMEAKGTFKTQKELSDEAHMYKSRDDDVAMSEAAKAKFLEDMNKGKEPAGNNFLRKKMKEDQDTDDAEEKKRADDAHRKKLVADSYIGAREKMEAEAEERVEKARMAELKRQEDAEVPYSKRSCYLFKPNGWIRLLCTFFAEHPLVDSLTTVVILLNCITMAMYDPFDEECKTDSCYRLWVLEAMITGYFTAEMSIKMIAFGVWGWVDPTLKTTERSKGSYLSDGWNRFDCFIVIVSLISLVDSAQQRYPDKELCIASVCTTVGAMRLPIDTGGISTLRTFRVIRPLRAANRFTNLRTLLSLLMTTLPMVGNVALIGVILFFGYSILGAQLFQGMYQRRCVNALGLPYEPAMPIMAPYVSPYYCSLPKDKGVNTCPPPANGTFGTCVETGTSSNPGQGFGSFDNTPSAWLLIFQMITASEWSKLMFGAVDAYSPMSAIYFVPLVFMGRFFLINLFLIVINSEFSHTKAKEQALLKLEAELKEKVRQKCMAEAISNAIYICETVTGEVAAYLRANSLHERGAEATVMEKWALQPGLQREDLLKIATESKKLAAKWQKSTDQGQPGLLDVTEAMRLLDKQLQYVMHVQLHPEGKEMSENWTPVYRLYAQFLEAVDLEQSYPELYEYHMYLHDCVTSNYFETPVMGAIMANVLLMASEHHGQSATLTSSQETGNLVFAHFFALEMVIKLFGMGPFKYCADGFNCFDGFIVIVSMVELYALSGGGGGALTVLRGFRLLRVFRLFRFSRGIKKQITIISHMMGDALAFVVLILMLVFIFAVLGLQLFGGKVKDIHGRTPDQNFDDILAATLSAWQVVTLDQWSVLRDDAIRNVGVHTVVYFIALIIFSAFLFRGLFVAIVLEGVRQQRYDEEQELLEGLSQMNKQQNTAFNYLKDMSKNVYFVYQRQFFAHWKEMWQRANKPEFNLVPAWQKEQQAAGDRIVALSRLVKTMNRCKEDSADELAAGSMLDHWIYLVEIRKQAEKLEAEREEFDRALQKEEEEAMGSDDPEVRKAWETKQARLEAMDLAAAEEERLGEGYNPMKETRDKEEKAQAARIALFDKNGDGIVDEDELNGDTTEEEGEEADEVGGEGTRVAVDTLLASEGFDDLAALVEAEGKGQDVEVIDDSKAAMSVEMDNLDALEKEVSQLEAEDIDKAANPVEEAEEAVAVTIEPAAAKTEEEEEADEELGLLAMIEKQVKEEEAAVSSSVVAPAEPEPDADLERFAAIGSHAKGTVDHFPLPDSPLDEDTDDEHAADFVAALAEAPAPDVSAEMDELLADLDAMEALGGLAAGAAGAATTGPATAVDAAGEASTAAGSGTGAGAADAFQAGRTGQNASYAKPKKLRSVDKNWDIDEGPGKKELEQIQQSEVESGLSFKSKLKRNDEAFVATVESDYIPPYLERNKYALCCLAEDNFIRAFCTYCVNHGSFENIILAIIVANSVCLTFERPGIEDGSPERALLDGLNWIFLFAFTAELGLKVISMGLIFGPNTYLDNGWNRLDIVIVISSWLYVIAPSGELKLLRILRLMRVLRPLRSVSRSPRLRLMVNAIFNSLEPLFHAVVICFTLCFIYAIFGVQLFGGRLYVCKTSLGEVLPALVPGLDGWNRTNITIGWDTRINATTNETIASIPSKFLYVNEYLGIDYTKCPTVDEWGRNVTSSLEVSDYNSDNVMNAFVMLYNVIKGNGWIEILHTCMNSSPEPKMPPIKGANRGMAAAYFISFVILGYFFMLAFFIGVIADNYSRMAVLSRHQQMKEMKREAGEEDSDAESDGEADMDLTKVAQAQQAEKAEKTKEALASKDETIQAEKKRLEDQKGEPDSDEVCNHGRPINKCKACEPSWRKNLENQAAFETAPGMLDEEVGEEEEPKDQLAASGGGWFSSWGTASVSPTEANEVPEPSGEPSSTASGSGTGVGRGGMMARPGAAAKKKAEEGGGSRLKGALGGGGVKKNTFVTSSEKSEQQNAANAAMERKREEERSEQASLFAPTTKEEGVKSEAETGVAGGEEDKPAAPVPWFKGGFVKNSSVVSPEEPEDGPVVDEKGDEEEKDESALSRKSALQQAKEKHGEAWEGMSTEAKKEAMAQFAGPVFEELPKGISWLKSTSKWKLAQAALGNPQEKEAERLEVEEKARVKAEKATATATASRAAYDLMEEGAAKEAAFEALVEEEATAAKLAFETKPRRNMFLIATENACNAENESLGVDQDGKGYNRFTNMTRTTTKAAPEPEVIMTQEEIETEYSCCGCYNPYMCGVCFCCGDFRRVVMTQEFDYFVLACIIANTIVMSCEFYGMSDGYADTLKVINYGFTIFFTFELVAKLSAVGLSYLESGWAQFDLFVVIVSLFSIGLDNGLEDAMGFKIGFSPTFLRILRVARVARLLKMTKSLLGVRALVNTMWYALPEVLNVFMLMFLSFFVFACAGVELFGTVGCTKAVCRGIDNRHTSFQDFPKSFLALFRVVTNDGTANMLRDFMRRAPYCDDSPDCKADCCAGAVLPELFFVSFYVVNNLIILNFIVAILIEQLRIARESQMADEIASHAEDLEAMDPKDLLAKLGLEVDLADRHESDIGMSAFQQARQEEDERMAQKAAERRHVAKTDKILLRAREEEKRKQRLLAESDPSHVDSQSKKAQAMMLQLNKPAVIHGEVHDGRAEQAAAGAKFGDFEEKKRLAFEKNKVFSHKSKKKKADVNTAVAGDEAYAADRPRRLKAGKGEVLEQDCPFTSLRSTSDPKVYRRR